MKPGMPAIIMTGYADIGAIAKRPEDVLVIGKPFSDTVLGDAIASVCTSVYG